MASRACAPMASQCPSAMALPQPAARAPVVSVASPVASVASRVAALVVPPAAQVAQRLVVVVQPVVEAGLRVAVARAVAQVVPQAVVVRLAARAVHRREFPTDLILSLSKDEVVALWRHALVVRQAHHEGY